MLLKTQIWSGKEKFIWFFFFFHLWIACCQSRNIKINVLMLCIFCAAFVFWKVPIVLPFTPLWKVESFCAQQPVWVHYSFYTHSQPGCCYHWNNGMIFWSLKLISHAICQQNNIRQWHVNHVLTFAKRMNCVTKRMNCIIDPSSI